MRTTILAAAVFALACPAFAQEAAPAPEPQTTVLYAPPGGVAMAVVYPTQAKDEAIVAAFADHLSATAHRLSASALLVAFDSPGACANVTISTTANDVRHRFCAEEVIRPGTADGVGVIRQIAACLMTGQPREACEGAAPESFKRSAEGTATSVRTAAGSEAE